MKKTLFVFLLATLAHSVTVNAQYYNTSAKHLYYESHNSSNDATHRILSFIERTAASNDTLYITQSDSVLPRNGQTKGNMSRQKIAYTHGNTIIYIMDETSLYDEMRIIVEDKKKEEEIKKKFSSKGTISISLNDRLKKGEKIKTSKFTIKAGPVKMTTTLSGEYQGLERIETPAGEFDCRKITYTIKATFFLFFSETSNVTEWYAKDIGLVKSEEYTPKEKSRTIKTLVDIKEPS